MKETMKCLLVYRRGFESKDATPLLELGMIDLVKQEFFATIMSVQKADELGVPEPSLTNVIEIEVDRAGMKSMIVGAAVKGHAEVRLTK